jgi:hypothetical protein
MPALYTTLREFKDSSIGRSISPFLPADDTLSWELMRSSDDADRRCDRILGKNVSEGTVTLTKTATMGDMALSVKPAVNIQPRDIVVIGSETASVLGAEVIDYASTNLTGTLTLKSSFINTYAAGTTLKVYREEQFTNGGRETRRYDLSTRIEMAKIAAMGKPILAQDASSRRIPLRQWPIWSVSTLYKQDPTSSSEGIISLTGLVIDTDEGFIRLPDGTVNSQGTVWRIQYSAGYAVIPYPIRQAVHYLTAASIMRGENPLGGEMFKVDDTESTHVASMYESEANKVLAPYRRRDATPQNETA